MEHNFNISLLDLPSLASALVSSSGVIQWCSPNWREFGYEGVVPDVQLVEVIPVFLGIFPLINKSKRIHLPLIFSKNQKYLDFDICEVGDKYLVLAIDVTDKAHTLQELQQTRNELEILKKDLKVLEE